MKPTMLEVVIATKRWVSVPAGYEVGTSRYICHAIEKAGSCSIDLRYRKLCIELTEQVMAHLRKLHQPTFDGLADTMLAGRAGESGYRLAQQLRHEWLDAKIKELSWT